MAIGRPCTTCRHGDRQGIESAIASGERFRGIARRYGLTPDAVERHAARHLPVDVARPGFRGRRGMTAADLIGRMVEVADSARAARLVDSLSARDVLPSWRRRAARASDYHGPVSCGHRRTRR
jgi:hypothetical protein